MNMYAIGFCFSCPFSEFRSFSFPFQVSQYFSKQSLDRCNKHSIIFSLTLERASWLFLSLLFSRRGLRLIECKTDWATQPVYICAYAEVGASKESKIYGRFRQSAEKRELPSASRWQRCTLWLIVEFLCGVSSI